MEKAFDVKVLVDRLKAKGLPVIEDEIQLVTKEVFAWAGESCILKGGLYALGGTLLPILAKEVDKIEDAIDGQAGV